MNFGTIEVNVQDILKIMNSTDKDTEGTFFDGVRCALNQILLKSTDGVASLEYDRYMDEHYVRYEYQNLPDENE